MSGNPEKIIYLADGDLIRKLEAIAQKNSANCEFFLHKALMEGLSLLEKRKNSNLNSTSLQTNKNSPKKS